MIAIERGECPPSLGGESSKGEKERAKAIAFFADPANSQKKFAFRAFKAADVKTALVEMCSGKCAYCETYYAGGGPLQAEHYRPKGEVCNSLGEIRKPGYYWLAGDWQNLLPSCPDCNTKRGHQYPDGRGVTGKATQFPLADESRRALSPGEEMHEEPLLLNPCLDDPSEHLEFDDDGVVRPASPKGVLSQRGEKTIEILGLHRPWLIAGRQKELRAIRVGIEHFERALLELDREPGNPVRLKQLDKEISELERLMDRDAPFACMARQLIEPVLKRAEKGLAAMRDSLRRARADAGTPPPSA